MAQASIRTSPERPVLAVFDLDGTLTHGDTLLPFLRFAAGAGGPPAGLVRRLPPLAGFAPRPVTPAPAQEALPRAPPRPAPPPRPEPPAPRLPRAPPAAQRPARSAAPDAPAPVGEERVRVRRRHLRPRLDQCAAARRRDLRRRRVRGGVERDLHRQRLRRPRARPAAPEKAQPPARLPAPRHPRGFQPRCRARPRRRGARARRRPGRARR